MQILKMFQIHFVGNKKLSIHKTVLESFTKTNTNPNKNFKKKNKTIIETKDCKHDLFTILFHCMSPNVKGVFNFLRLQNLFSFSF
jgi:hypothetical protein